MLPSVLTAPTGTTPPRSCRCDPSKSATHLPGSEHGVTRWMTFSSPRLRTFPYRSTSRIPRQKLASALMVIASLDSDDLRVSSQWHHERLEQIMNSNRRGFLRHSLVVLGAVA